MEHENNPGSWCLFKRSLALRISTWVLNVIDDESGGDSNCRNVTTANVLALQLSAASLTGGIPMPLALAPCCGTLSGSAP